jgi:hypothetical protein
MARKRKPAVDDKFNFDDEGKAAAAEGAWFDATTEDDRGQMMVDSAQQIETSPAEMKRQDFNLLYGSLFEGVELTNLYQYGGAATRGLTDRGTGVAAESTWNQVRSVITTVSSQVSRSKPRARCVTTAGNWRQQQKAKKLTQLGDGLFSLNRVYEKTQTGFMQAGAWDVVGLETMKGLDRPELAVVRGYEILIDANDGIDASPQTLYRRKFLSRRTVMRLAKTDAQKAAVASAQKEDPTLNGGRTDLIRVYEAWHLPSAKGAGDGRHVIAVKGEGGTLVDEPWTKMYHAIRLFCWDAALSGPYGRSAAEVLLPNQIAINILLDRIAKAQHLACVPRVGIQRGSKILKSELTNQIGSVIQFGTMPPVWWSPTALSPEVYQHLERHWAKGFEAYGVSPSLASGQKATGTVSGEAIRESLDVQTARFAVLSQRWEQLHLDIFRAFVDICRELYENDPDKRVAAPGTELLDSIRWKDIDLEEDAYVIEAYPTSLLPTTPQGRIDRVKELVSEGIWSPKRGEAALDDLDVEANMNAERGAEKEAMKICEDMLQDGKYRTPDPACDLATFLRIGTQYRQAGETGNVPEKHLDQIYKWLDDVAALQAQLTPKPAPAMPGAPAAPGAPPAAPAAAPPAPGLPMAA